MSQVSGGSMETLSGRVPGELYRWFAELEVEGVVTNSDKLRVLLGRLKRQHDGSLDYVSAQAWLRDILAPLRQSLAELERDEKMHSEVMVSLLEHLTALLALLLSSQVNSKESAIALEEALTKRAFLMTESLLRQAFTNEAAAFKPKVVRDHCDHLVQLAKLIN